MIIKYILRPENDWEDAYPQVGALVTAFLDAHSDQEFSTGELADILWPKKNDGLEGKARDRLFKCLKALARNDLEPYAIGRKMTRVYGKKVQAVVWKSPGYDL